MRAGRFYKPTMSGREIEIVSSLLKSQQAHQVLEWGAGDSTVNWPGRFRSVRRWVAIEHSEKWYQALKDRVDPKVVLRLWGPEDYYARVFREGEKFDFILVDGVYRRACLVVAFAVVAPGGIVVLHDAGRAEYVPSWGVWPHFEVLCAGELPAAGGKGFRHRGIAVFWRDEDVPRDGWCRDHKLRSA